MGTERFVAAAVSLLAAHAVAAPSFGIAMAGHDGRLRVYAPANSPSGAGIDVQYPGTNNRPVCCLRLTSGDFEPAPPNENAVDVGSGEVLAQRVSRRPLPQYGGTPFVGIATFGAPALPRQTAANALQVTARDSARSCVSSEGFHVKTYRAGRPVDDYYLGFDYSALHPTCPKPSEK